MNKSFLGQIFYWGLNSKSLHIVNVDNYVLESSQESAGKMVFKEELIGFRF